MLAHSTGSFGEKELGREEGKGIKEKKRVNYLWKRLFWEEVIECPTGSLASHTIICWSACYADTQTPAPFTASRIAWDL